MSAGGKNVKDLTYRRLQDIDFSFVGRGAVTECIRAVGKVFTNVEQHVFLKRLLDICFCFDLSHIEL